MKEKFQGEFWRAIWDSNFTNKILDIFPVQYVGTDTFTKVTKI